MPKPSAVTLAWSTERGCYEIIENGAAAWTLVDEAAWRDWLAIHHSFTFVGKGGRLNLLKESRNGGAGYWYAYRRHGRKVVKRYAGRSTEVTVALLEQIAVVLVPKAPSNIDQAATPTDRVPQTRMVMPGRAVEPSPTPPSQLTPLLVPKLRPPRLQGDLIRRERLLAKLDAGVPRRLTMISAPAGFGKTTLLRQWIAERAGDRRFPAVSWVRLDPDDNDPLRFWRYVITACQQFGSRVTDESIALLRAPSHLPFKHSPLQTAIAALLNELVHASRGILVLEDYHVIDSPQIHETVMFLLDHLPASLHIVIVSRQNPLFPLVRFRVAGELTTIDSSDLRFTSEEAQHFLQQTTRILLTPDLIEILETHVEGWAVGLRMLSLALEGKTNRQQIEANVRAFASRPHSLQDYVVSEVLNEQPAPVQRFLLETSMLARLNASLCDAVTGLTTSAGLLNQMDRGNVLLEPLDDANTWYRYHALFAAAMQQEAQRRLGSETLRELTRRAADWYEQHDMLVEAAEAALQGNDMTRSASLIGRIVGTHSVLNGPHVLQPGYHTLRRWLEQLPQEAFVVHPRLLLVHAAALLFSFSLDMLPLSPQAAAQIDELLLRAEQTWAAHNDAGLGECFAFRSMILRQRGEFGPAAEWASKALHLLPDDDWGGRSLSLNAIGFLEMSNGRLDLAEQSIRAAHALCEKMGNPVYVRANSAMLGWTLFEQGKLYAAEAQLARVLVEARAEGDTDDVARSLHALAEIAYEWNDLLLAQRQIEESVRLSESFGHVYEVHLGGVLMLARVEVARGLVDAAHERFALLRERAETYQTAAQYTTYRDICVSHARLHLHGGDLAAARRVFSLVERWPEQPLFQREREQRMRARLLLAEGKANEALALLQHSLGVVEAGGPNRVVWQTQALLALAHAALRQSEPARHLLSTALAHAHSEGAFRVFLDEGRTMAELLHAILPGIREKHLSAYVRQLLHAFAAQQPPGDADTAFTDVLSAQEGRVLRLLTLGYSNEAIARELVVSVNTVKAHLKHIYRKLGVSSRVQAAAAAKIFQDC